VTHFYYFHGTLGVTPDVTQVNRNCNEGISELKLHCLKLINYLSGVKGKFPLTILIILAGNVFVFNVYHNKTYLEWLEVVLPI